MSQVNELEMTIGQLGRDKEELQRAKRQHEEEASRAMGDECQRLHRQNQDLLKKVNMDYFTSPLSTRPPLVFCQQNSRNVCLFVNTEQSIFIYVFVCFIFNRASVQ